MHMIIKIPGQDIKHLYGFLIAMIKLCKSMIYVYFKLSKMLLISSCIFCSKNNLFLKQEFHKTLINIKNYLLFYILKYIKQFMLKLQQSFFSSLNLTFYDFVLYLVIGKVYFAKQQKCLLEYKILFTLSNSQFGLDSENTLTLYYFLKEYDRKHKIV